MNLDTIICKLRLVLTKTNNNKFKVARKKKFKKEEVKEMRKAKDITAKRHRAWGRINLSRKKKDENNTKNDKNPDPTKKKYSLQL